MRILLLMLLLVCGISCALASDQKATGVKQKAAKQQPGSETAPIFIKKLATDEEKATSNAEEKEREKKWAIDIETLKVAKEARVAAEDAAKYAGYGLLLALVAAGIAFLQWRMFGKQLALMESSNETASTAANTAKNEFEASQRPWIKVQLHHTGDLVREKEGGLALPLSIKMENIGNMVAQNAYPHPGFYLGEGFADEVKNRQSQLALEFKPIADSNHAGMTIFPGDSFTVPMTIRVSKGDVDEKSGTHAEMGFADCLPALFVVGSVHYKSAISSRQYRTGFIRELASSQIAKPGTRIQLPKTDVIGKDEIAMRQYISGDGYID